MPTVLVVDDTDAVRTALVKLLEREGYETQSATSGQEAIDRLEADATHPPDVVLLDLTAAEMDNLDALDSMMRDARWRAVPVIMMTGEHDYHGVRRAEQLGAKNRPVSAAFSVSDTLQQIDRYTRH